MADTAAAAAPTKGADAPSSKSKQQFVKPEKPDEEKYKTELAKLEKEHAGLQEKFVCSRPSPF
jgi:hypothetical protein